jgi:hypothetical protein
MNWVRIWKVPLSKVQFQQEIGCTSCDVLTERVPEFVGITPIVGCPHSHQEDREGGEIFHPRSGCSTPNHDINFQHTHNCLLRLVREIKNHEAHFSALVVRLRKGGLFQIPNSASARPASSHLCSQSPSSPTSLHRVTDRSQGIRGNKRKQRIASEPHG